ncbi:hypothetical protein JR316_0002143 [Psilocybe cubensis]|uniref:Uncharacterized protein n=2 Tax=Psilocybe cubensis TaxID=181762 RepID=A0ACB8HBK6_PSICU|nr:hypothetical protein JR316_0002143 [Psilocybe cubensis]KAH9485236.1 hypothetical protein JR316_0002143 [Psilocybe cubensis]
MRHSVAPNRASQVSSNANATAAAVAKLLEKKKEYEGVAALERASALYLERLEALGDDCETMAKAGEVHGQVLTQWPKMFQILGQFLEAQGTQEPEDGGQSATSSSMGQRLVRIPIEELQPGNEKS